MASRLFNSPLGMTLANDADDCRAICVAAGRIGNPVDLPDERLRDVTDEALNAVHPAGLQESLKFSNMLKGLLEAGRRGCVYFDPNGWVVLPLSADCAWLHHNATELVDCPACGAPAGFPCDPEKSPIMEGTCHRRRVRALVHQHPEVLDKSLLPSDD